MAPKALRLTVQTPARTATPSAAEVVARLEHLANVPRGALREALLSNWRPGDERVSNERIAALRNEYVLRAATKNRERARQAHEDVREIIDELRRVTPRLTKTKAFERVARDRSLAVGTVRNAYYGCH
jgi:hypothetical protein